MAPEQHRGRAELCANWRGGWRLFLSTNGNVGIGTISPASPLEVVGNIQMGAGGTNYAASGSENLRLVRGVISPTGSILSGSGFNVVSNNVGKFTITFTPVFPITLPLLSLERPALPLGTP